MTITYPAGLPHPLRESYGFESVNNIVRSDLVSGRARQRQRFTSVPSFATLTWLFKSNAEAQLFDAWTSQVAKAEWVRMTLTCPLGLIEHDVRFAESPSGPVRSGVRFWRYTARVELRERPLLEPGWAGILPDYILGSDIFDRAMNQEWPQ
ncbi:MAG: hypothetical protein A2002_09465 [Pseudomonadales bacterium GWC1_66_9]|nr:MAG: hypothetical protein A2002_09465 [Pseudomonadales bacterium GWC1_66_9]